MNSILLAATSSSAGMGLFKPLYWLFGVCMGFLMDLLNNQYFVAIVIFTVVTRVILLPFNIHQQKTMAKTARLQPKLAKLQKKYPDPKDRMKLQQETQDLYAREGHNPMQMGCGPMLFQMVFLMGIIGIIYYPLFYVLGMKGFADQSANIAQVVQELGYKGQYLQLGILENFGAYKDTLVEKFPTLFTADNCAAIQAYRDGMVIGNLDMTAIPHWKDGIIIIVPLLCLVTSLASTLVSTMIQKKNNPAAAQWPPGWR